MIRWVHFILALLTAVTIHELGHMLTALWCKIKVEAFSIGFGKPLFHKVIKGIDFRFSLLLIGGYTKIAGEYDKRPDGLLAQRYLKKVLVLVAGAFMNVVLAFVCYWINYKSVTIGMYIDWNLFLSIFTDDYSKIIHLINFHQPNMFLLQLSLINFICGILNLLPIPALDGGYLWLFLLEKKIKNFSKFLKTICTIGFVVLTEVQLLMVYYILVLK